ncbi:MAG TPA: alginate O-acetyltransferase AlgF [Deinococcales bacterium]|nr:alginate O-acetyltransferase AlgF [Deinococcales bacterium]
MKRASLAVALSLTLPAALAAAPGLYSPEPPANSAFARFVPASLGGPNEDVYVDGTLRAKNLAPGKPSNYLVVTAGSHSVKVSTAGKTDSLATYTLQAEAKRFYTLPVQDGKVTLLSDGTNKDKLKALLAVYNLAASGNVNVTTADGSTKVFTGVAPGTARSLAVNAVTVDLKVALGTAAPVTLKKTTFSSGGAYSIFVLAGKDGPSVGLVQNRTESYSGK